MGLAGVPPVGGRRSSRMERCWRPRQARRPVGPPAHGPALAGRRSDRRHRAGPAPAESPELRMPAAPGRPPDGVRSGHRRVVRTVFRAVPPCEVSHTVRHQVRLMPSARRPDRSRTPSATPTGTRASSCRRPSFMTRSTGTDSSARKPSTARWASSGDTVGSSTRQIEAAIRSGNEPPRASTTSSTSSPGGNDSSRAFRTASGSQCSITAISRYSASLAVPVGAAPA